MNIIRGFVLSPQLLLLSAIQCTGLLYNHNKPRKNYWNRYQRETASSTTTMTNAADRSSAAGKAAAGTSSTSVGAGASLTNSPRSSRAAANAAGVRGLSAGDAGALLAHQSPSSSRSITRAISPLAALRNWPDEDDEDAGVVEKGKQAPTAQTRKQQFDHRTEKRTSAGAESSSSSSLGLVSYLAERHNPAYWSSYEEKHELFVQELPKVELHVHLDGSFDPSVVWSYLQEEPGRMLCLPTETDLPWEADGRKLKVRQLIEECKSAREYHQLCTCRGYRSLNAMLTCFEMFLPVARRNLDLIEQLAYDFCQRQWEQNVVYTEVRYSPHLLAEGFDTPSQSSDDENAARSDGDNSDGAPTTSSSSSSSSSGPAVDGEAVFLAVRRGLRKGCAKFHITINQILCGITWKPQWAHDTLDLALKYRDDYPCATVGIDVAAGELHFDKDNHPDLHGPHYDMIQRAKGIGFPITIHAGETPDSLDNVRRAITEYGASRIGHGYRMVESVELMKEVRDKGVHVEVCPTSSVETGGWEYEQKNWEEHPCLTMMEHEISFSLNSDDPAVFHTSLAWQYRIALAKMKLSRTKLLRSNCEAIDAAFCSQEEKDRIKYLIQCYGSLELLETPTPPPSSSACNGVDKSARRRLRQSVSDTFTDRVHLE